ncbi:MAG TPA: RluA family pseudouridine synthase [Calditrichaeota bacterium]|nr:RluA family pseudouridine synthase [Calditrichota bacterium]
MGNSETIRVSEAVCGLRIDQFLTEKFPQHTRSYFSKLLKNHFVTVNDEPVKAGYKLKQNDVIFVEFHKEILNLQPADIALDIVYEDEHILIVNKTAGMTVHPGKGTEDDTLVHALLHHVQQLAEDGQKERPGIVHRLDKYTSGLLVIAKTDLALAKLRAQFDTRQIHRTYQALVWGKPRLPQGKIETCIARSKKDPTKMTVTKEGKEAVTRYKLIRDFEYASLLDIELDTGRTHQIRVHMNYIHHPVIGDPDYNGRDTQLKRLPPNLHKRGKHLLKMLPHQALHAKRLSFIHPVSEQRMEFDSLLPQPMAEAVQKLPGLFLVSA